nr:IS3 family transposase [Parafrankia sp. BMG5.11]
MAAEGLPAQKATRVLGVSESGYCFWRDRPPSARAVRHAWLTEQIEAVHTMSNGVYGARRAHAELTLGLGISVGHGAVELLMRNAGLKGLPGNRRRRPRHQTPTAGDLVDRRFTRERPTGCGSPTSPSIQPGKARSTAPSSSTSTPAASPAGRSIVLGTDADRVAQPAPLEDPDRARQRDL